MRIHSVGATAKNCKDHRDDYDFDDDGDDDDDDDDCDSE